MKTSTFINSNIKLKGIQQKPKAKKCIPRDIREAMSCATYHLSGHLYKDITSKKSLDTYSDIYFLDHLFQNVPTIFSSKFTIQEDDIAILPDSSVMGTMYLFGNKDTIFGEVSPDKTGVIGWHYLKNGAPFYGFFMNDPIALPVVACLYLGEDSLLHTFVPFYGNTFNTDFLCSIGNEFDSEIYHEVCDLYVEKQYLSKTFSTTSYSASYDVTDRYLNRYGFRDITDVRVSWSAMREDIETTIGVS